jgi:hypothetical protein
MFGGWSTQAEVVGHVGWAVGYVTGAAIFLLLALGQFGQYRHDRSDVRQLRLLVAVVLGLAATMMLAVGAWRHWL